MSFTLGGMTVYDAAKAAAECRRLQLPDIVTGRANHFTCPLGGQPGRGYLILKRGDLDKLGIGGDAEAFQTLKIVAVGTSAITMPKIVMTGHLEAIHPGADGDATTRYLVEIADRRWLEWERGEPLYVAYNCRSDATGDYVEATTNSGTAWTWNEILDDIWPTTLGTVPTLPFTPHGDPETFWYQGETRLQAVDPFLTRLVCALRYDPVADTFDIVQLGAAAAPSDATLDGLKKHRVYDTYPMTPRTSILPETIRVQHRVKRSYTDGTLPYYTQDVTVDPAAGPVAADTIVLLRDDLIAQYNGTSITNTTDLQARRDERAEDYIRKRRYFDRGELRTYAGARSLHECLGSRWRAVAWKDMGRGMLTEIVSGAAGDRSLEDWWRHESVDSVANVCPQ